MEANPTAAARNEGNESPHPLAWNQAGDPFELPGEAHVWRVRRLQSGTKGGAPETVYGADGLPLRLETSTSAEEFGELVGRRAGKYRLDALNVEGNTLADCPSAYVVVTEDQAPTRAKGDLNGAFSLIERMSRTLADAMDRQASRMAELVDASARLVCAADSAGVTRREPPPQVIVSPAAEPVPVVAQAQGPAVTESVIHTVIKAIGPENVPAFLGAMPEMVVAMGGVIKDLLGTFRSKVADPTSSPTAGVSTATGAGVAS